MPIMDHDVNLHGINHINQYWRQNHHQMFDARWLHKYVATLYICLFDTFHTLHINVQDANASRATYVSNGFFAMTQHSKITVWYYSSEQ